MQLPFSIDICIRSHTAKRHGIDNEPKDIEIIKCLEYVYKHIYVPLCKEYGKENVLVGSWFRCLELNRLLGSKDTSQHPKGQAIDFEILGKSNLEVYEWCKKNLKYDQLLLENHKKGLPRSGWIHASYVANGKNRMDAKELHV